MTGMKQTRTVMAPVVPTRAGRLTPLSLGDVSLTGGMLGELQHRNATAILDHIQEWIERAGWVENFRLAASGDVVGRRSGREFSDSEIYKVLEAMSWEHGRTGDEALDERIRALTAVVAAAQEPDGYLNTNFGREGQRARYSDFEWGHELYNYGHLLQAAVARGRGSRGPTTGWSRSRAPWPSTSATSSGRMAAR